MWSCGTRDNDSFDEILAILNVLNILIRKHNIPLPPEIKNKFVSNINLLKTTLLNAIKSLPTDFFIGKFNKNNQLINIHVNTDNLAVLRDLIEDQMALLNPNYLDE